MDKLLRLKQLLGIPEISQGKLRSFIQAKQGSLPKVRIPFDVKTISIVVPCYNHEPYLDKMFESIISQTRQPEKVIFVNDSSSDNTADRLLKLMDHQLSSAASYTLINNDNNIGQSESLNKAIQEVETDLVMILNDDDYLCHDAVEVAMELFNCYRDLYLLGSTAVHFEADEVLDAGNKYIREILNHGKLGLTMHYPSDVPKYRNYNDLNMTHSGSCFLKSAWEVVGGYRPDKRQRLVPFSDRDFQLRVNALFLVAVSDEIPFSFWRSNSSVDRGVDS